MIYDPVPYTFTENDIEELKRIGYNITETGKSFVDFICENFANFNLLALLKVVENQFANTTNKKIHRKIIINKIKKTLRVEFMNEGSNEDDAVLFIREFVNENGDIYVVHECCVIPKESRNNGLIKPVFQESLRQYVNIGAKKIFVYAGLSRGGYAWAKHGFVATNKGQVDVILEKAKANLHLSDFEIVTKIYERYYAEFPSGEKFPIEEWAAMDCMKDILMGSKWHGELDLKDEEQFRNFKNYVSR